MLNKAGYGQLAKAFQFSSFGGSPANKTNGLGVALEVDTVEFWFAYRVNWWLLKTVSKRKLDRTLSADGSRCQS